MPALPPFRAEHVGSLLRPARLVDARRLWLIGRLDRAAFEAVEDACVAEAVAMQEEVGLEAVNDGGYRRGAVRDVFFERVGGFSARREPADFAAAAPVPRVEGRLARSHGIVLAEFRALHGRARRTAKVILPAPSTMHFHRGDAVLDGHVYPDAAEYLADVAAIYRKELADLAALGCRYVQFDEGAIPALGDPAIRAVVTARGEDPERLVDLYVRALNDALRDRPRAMAAVVHLARDGVGAGLAADGCEPIAERVFAEIGADGFVLGLDPVQEAGASVLRFVPPGRRVNLGIVDARTSALESAGALARRIEAAGRYLSLAQIGIATTGGFEGAGGALDPADERRKLERLVEVARIVWGAGDARR